MTRVSWVSLAAAVALTAQAEWTLAQAVGWWEGVAWCWPLAVDLYVIASFRARRDRAWAIALMATSVAGAHALPRLWPAGMPWLAAGLMSVVPVLVAWRVHEMPALKTSGPAAVTAPAAGPAINTQGPDPRRPGQEETWSSTARPAGTPGSSTPSRGASPRPLTPPAGPLSAPAPAAGLAAASSHPAGPRPVPTDPGDRPGQLYIEADLIAAARPVVAGLRMRGRAVNYKNLAPALREQGHQVGRAKAEALIAALSAA